MGTGEDYTNFNDPHNPNGRAKYTKESLFDTRYEGEGPVTRSYSPQLSDEEINKIIFLNILPNLDKPNENLTYEVKELVKKYVGHEIEALNVLVHAANKKDDAGRNHLAEYMAKLEAKIERIDLAVAGNHDMPDEYKPAKFLREFIGELEPPGISEKITPRDLLMAEHGINDIGNLDDDEEKPPQYALDG